MHEQQTRANRTRSKNVHVFYLIRSVLAKMYVPKTGEDPTQHIKHNTASFFCAPTDPTEIINIVKSANSSKSSGVDNIDPYVVQKIIPQ